jgi:hypothetical protein
MQTLNNTKYENEGFDTEELEDEDADDENFLFHKQLVILS